MNLTPEIVKNLLNILVSPKYHELIYDYMVEVSDFNDGSSYFKRKTIGIVIGVIVHPEVYYEMDTYTGNPLSGIDRQITKDIKDALKYLGNNISDISVYVLEDNY